MVKFGKRKENGAALSPQFEYSFTVSTVKAEKQS
jgi:hypothetical protein